MKKILLFLLAAVLLLQFCCASAESFPVLSVGDNGPEVLEVITWEVIAITVAAVFVFGLLITFLCSYVSVNKFLKMTAGELYKI